MNNKEERFQIKLFGLPNEITSVTAFAVAKDSLIFTSMSSNAVYKIVYKDKDEDKDKDKSMSITSYQIPMSSKADNYDFQVYSNINGNHVIIKHYGKLFYFNSNIGIVKELIHLSKINVTSIGWDNSINSLTTTDKIIIGDDSSNLYEYSITLEKDDKIKEKLSPPLFTLSKESSDTGNGTNTGTGTGTCTGALNIDPIYGLYLTKNDSFTYILAVTSNRMYQFAGESIKSIASTISDNLSLLDSCCITFPSSLQSYSSKLQLVLDPKLNISSIGWQCVVGFCLSTFKDTKNSAFIDNFQITPYQMRVKEQKIPATPLSIAHSEHHIFYLFNDNISVVSKITSNLVYKYEDAFKDIIYDNFRNVLWIRTNNSLHQLPLQDERTFLWQDYIENGEYDDALDIARRTNLKYAKTVYKIVADISFDLGEYTKGAEEYAYSNEHFESVCFKLLHSNRINALKDYLLWLIDIRIPDEQRHAKCLVCTLLLQLYISDINTIEDFEHLSNELGKLMTYLNQNKNYLDKSTVYDLLLQCGLANQYLEYAEIMGDYEAVVLYYINSNTITYALQKLDYYTSIESNSFASILNKYTQLFIKENVKLTIDILRKVSTKFEIDSNQLICGMLSVDHSQIDNMCEYLQSLIEESSKDKIVHNLYLYFISHTKDPNLKEVCLKYLEDNLKHYMDIKDIAPEPLKEIPFEIEYALKIFSTSEFYEAHALVLAMKEKYREAIGHALINEKLSIAMTIAKIVGNTKLKKELWLEIFKDQIKRAEESLVNHMIKSHNNNQGQANVDPNEILNPSSQSKLNQDKEETDINKKVDQALDIIKQSNCLKIEDVLPHMVDNIKIKEFKDQIAQCIEGYEQNLKVIKQDISSYNVTAESIKSDLAVVKKKSIDVQYNCCQCDICQRDIKQEKVIIFTCGHMFDSKCMMNVIMKLAKFLPNAKEKNDAINALKKKIDQIENKKEIMTCKTIGGEDGKKGNKKDKGVNSIELKASGSSSGMAVGQNSEQVVKARVALSYDEIKRVEELNAKIAKILIEECVKCGNMIIESVQCPFMGNEYSWMIT